VPRSRSRSQQAPSGRGCRRRSRCFRCATGSRGATSRSFQASCSAAASRSARSTRSASAPAPRWPPHTPSCADRSRDAPVVCVDETGWRQAGERRTLRGAFIARHAAFQIAADRHERELRELIGERFAGIVCSDRWWAYDRLDPARRQVCWAHLLRDFRRHSEGLADQQRFRERGLEICRRLLRGLGRVRRARRSLTASGADRPAQARAAGSARARHDQGAPTTAASAPSRATCSSSGRRSGRSPSSTASTHQQRRRARPARRRHLPQSLARQPIRHRRPVRRADAVDLPNLPPPAALAVRLPDRRARRLSPTQPRTLPRLTPTTG
jgi:Transposase IS66 family